MEITLYIVSQQVYVSPSIKEKRFRIIEDNFGDLEVADKIMTNKVYNAWMWFQTAALAKEHITNSKSLFL